MNNWTIRLLRREEKGDGLAIEALLGAQLYAIQPHVLIYGLFDGESLVAIFGGGLVPETLAGAVMEAQVIDIEEDNEP